MPDFVIVWGRRHQVGRSKRLTEIERARSPQRDVLNVKSE